MCKKTDCGPFEHGIHAQLRIYPGKWDAQSSLGFWDTNGSPNLGQTSRPCDSHKKKNSRIVKFAVPTDHRVKIKESKERDR